MSGDICFARETYAEAIDEGRALFAKHWEEIALYKEVVPLAPDEDIYRALDAADRLRVFTARLNGGLIGYAVYFVVMHPHYKTTKWAKSDVLFVLPAHRKGFTGPSLLRFAEGRLRADGVVVMHTTAKSEHIALGRVLEMLGHKEIERGYSKLL